MHEDLEPLANLRIGREMDRTAKTVADELPRLNADFARRGLIQSGPFIDSKLKLYLKAAQELCQEVANTWRDLILRMHGRLSREDVNFINSKVAEFAASQDRNIRGAMHAPDQLNSGNWVGQRISTGISSIKTQINRDLEIERRESDVAPAATVLGTNEAFVIMADRTELKPLYSQAIEPAIRANGLAPYLMVHREPDSSISNEILSRIESCMLLIADLTFERPNCYYEAGYAHAKNKKVIFTAREDHNPRRPNRQISDPKVHFDLDSHRFSFWYDGQWTALEAELRQRIAEAMNRKNTISTIGDRLGEKGELQVLELFRAVQKDRPAAALLFDHFIAQELGWPIDEVRLILKHLTEKDWLRPMAGGYMLAHR